MRKLRIRLVTLEHYNGIVEICSRPSTNDKHSGPSAFERGCRVAMVLV
jgi:hypothetical protein